MKGTKHCSFGQHKACLWTDSESSLCLMAEEKASVLEEEEEVLDTKTVKQEEDRCVITDPCPHKAEFY